MKKCFTRGSALLTLFFFLFSSFSPVSFAEIPGIQTFQYKTNDAAAPSFRLDLPSELGTVETLQPGNGPAVVHIQTAHGNYEAQKKIQGILEFLNKNYGFKHILVEGSPFKFHNEYLRFFPEDMAATHEIAGQLTRESLMSGPELFLIDHPEVEAHGIENLETYKANGLAFYDVLSRQEKTGKFLSGMDMQIDSLAGAYLNKDLRAFLARLDSFEAKRVPFMDWFSYIKERSAEVLGIHLTDAAYQMDWPMMLRLYTLGEIEKKLDVIRLEKEKGEFLKAVKSIPQDIREKVSTLLNTQVSRSRLSDPETRVFFEQMVSALPQNFNYEAFPNVKLFIGHLILQSEMRGELLMKEEKRLAVRITDKLAKTKEEKELAGLLADYRLLKKLFALELTPENYDSILQRGADITPSKVAKRFAGINKKKLVKNVKFGHLAEIDGLFSKALEFYRLVKKRDAEMIFNVAEKIRGMKTGKVAVITGGFHSSPFQDYFSQNDFSYALVSPRITSIEGDAGRSSYVKAVMETLRGYSSQTYQLGSAFANNAAENGKVFGSRYSAARLAAAAGARKKKIEQTAWHQANYPEVPLAMAMSEMRSKGHTETQFKEILDKLEKYKGHWIVLKGSHPFGFFEKKGVLKSVNRQGDSLLLKFDGSDDFAVRNEGNVIDEIWVGGERIFMRLPVRSEIRMQIDEAKFERVIGLWFNILAGIKISQDGAEVSIGRPADKKGDLNLQTATKGQIVMLAYNAVTSSGKEVDFNVPVKVDRNTRSIVEGITVQMDENALAALDRIGWKNKKAKALLKQFWTSINGQSLLQSNPELQNSTAISRFEWSSRPANLFQKLKITDIRKLRQYTAKELLEQPNFAEDSLDEVRRVLAENGMFLSGDNPEDVQASLAQKKKRKPKRSEMRIETGSPIFRRPVFSFSDKKEHAELLWSILAAGEGMAVVMTIDPYSFFSDKDEISLKVYHQGYSAGANLKADVTVPAKVIKNAEGVIQDVVITGPIQRRAEQSSTEWPEVAENPVVSAFWKQMKGKSLSKAGWEFGDSHLKEGLIGTSFAAPRWSEKDESRHAKILRTAIVTGNGRVIRITSLFPTDLLKKGPEDIRMTFEAHHLNVPAPPLYHFEVPVRVVWKAGNLADVLVTGDPRLLAGNEWNWTRMTASGFFQSFWDGLKGKSIKEGTPELEISPNLRSELRLQAEYVPREAIAEIYSDEYPVIEAAERIFKAELGEGFTLHFSGLFTPSSKSWPANENKLLEFLRNEGKVRALAQVIKAQSPDSRGLVIFYEANDGNFYFDVELPLMGADSKRVKTWGRFGLHKDEYAKSGYLLLNADANNSDVQAIYNNPFAATVRSESRTLALRPEAPVAAQGLSPRVKAALEQINKIAERLSAIPYQNDRQRDLAIFNAAAPRQILVPLDLMRGTPTYSTYQLSETEAFILSLANYFPSIPRASDIRAPFNFIRQLLEDPKVDTVAISLLTLPVLFDAKFTREDVVNYFRQIQVAAKLEKDSVAAAILTLALYSPSRPGPDDVITRFAEVKQLIPSPEDNLIEAAILTLATFTPTNPSPKEVTTLYLDGQSAIRTLAVFVLAARSEVRELEKLVLEARKGNIEAVKQLGATSSFVPQFVLARLLAIFMANQGELAGESLKALSRLTAGEINRSEFSEILTRQIEARRFNDGNDLAKLLYLVRILGDNGFRLYDFNLVAPLIESAIEDMDMPETKQSAERAILLAFSILENLLLSEPGDEFVRLIKTGFGATTKFGEALSKTSERLAAIANAKKTPMGLRLKIVEAFTKQPFLSSGFADFAQFLGRVPETGTEDDKAYREALRKFFVAAGKAKVPVAIKALMYQIVDGNPVISEILGEIGAPARVAIFTLLHQAILYPERHPASSLAAAKALQKIVPPDYVKTRRAEKDGPNFQFEDVNMASIIRDAGRPRELRVEIVRLASFFDLPGVQAAVKDLGSQTDGQAILAEARQPRSELREVAAGRGVLLRERVNGNIQLRAANPATIVVANNFTFGLLSLYALAAAAADFGLAAVKFFIALVLGREAYAEAVDSASGPSLDEALPPSAKINFPADLPAVLKKFGADQKLADADGGKVAASSGFLIKFAQKNAGVFVELMEIYKKLQPDNGERVLVTALPGGMKPTEFYGEIFAGIKNQKSGLTTQAQRDAAMKDLVDVLEILPTAGKNEAEAFKTFAAKNQGIVFVGSAAYEDFNDALQLVIGDDLDLKDPRVAYTVAGVIAHMKMAAALFSGIQDPSRRAEALKEYMARQLALNLVGGKVSINRSNFVRVLNILRGQKRLETSV